MKPQRDEVRVRRAHQGAWLTRLTGFAEKDADRLRDLLVRIGLPVTVKLAPKKRQALLDAMRLANAIGEVVPGQRVPDSDINSVLNQIEAA